jgi:hypothetical protein
VHWRCTGQVLTTTATGHIVASETTAATTTTATIKPCDLWNLCTTRAWPTLGFPLASPWGPAKPSKLLKARGPSPVPPLSTQTYLVCVFTWPLYHRLVPLRLLNSSTDPATPNMFIPFLSHFRARGSQAWRVDAYPNDDDALTSYPGDSNIYLIFDEVFSPTHPLERRKGGGGGGRGRGSSSTSALSAPLLIITAHPFPPPM